MAPAMRSTGVRGMPARKSFTATGTMDVSTEKYEVTGEELDRTTILACKPRMNNGNSHPFVVEPRIERTHESKDCMF